MKKYLQSIPTCLLTALLIFAGEARGETCKFAEGGHGYVKVLKGSERLAYTIQIQGSEWQEEPYGYHATGQLKCSQCLGSAASASGLYHFSSEEDVQKFEPEYPRAASQRIARGEESVGYPPVDLRSGQLKVLEVRDDLSVGPLSGYSVLYQVAPLAAGANRSEIEVAEEAFSLLVVSLTDHCITFETTVLINSQNDQILKKINNTLFDSIIFKRTMDSEAKLPNTQAFKIRPRQSGDKLIFLFEKNK
jgi:hypothetical protein